VVHARVCVSLTHSMTGMRKVRVRGPCVVTGRLTGAPYLCVRDRLEALEVPCVPPGPLGCKLPHRVPSALKGRSNLMEALCQ
jgi:hypothetical protein